LVVEVVVEVEVEAAVEAIFLLLWVNIT